VSLSQTIEIIEDVLSDLEEEEEEVLEAADIYRPEYYRIKDARWRMKDCTIPDTQVPRYARGADNILEAELKLGSASWMQDWPLEVSDRRRVEEFCAFYDRAINPVVKFDTMQLALFSYDDGLRYSQYSEGQRTQLDEARATWFDRTLRRDFALHGNTIADWATLDRDREDPEFSLTDPEFVFAISGQLRRIWEDSLIPIDIHWQTS
jgi:hypothetical protein